QAVAQRSARSHPRPAGDSADDRLRLVALVTTGVAKDPVCAVGSGLSHAAQDAARRLAARFCQGPAPPPEPQDLQPDSGRTEAAGAVVVAAGRAATHASRVHSQAVSTRPRRSSRPRRTGPGLYQALPGMGPGPAPR